VGAIAENIHDLFTGGIAVAFPSPKDPEVLK